jgi:hypothetical protein
MGLNIAAGDLQAAELGIVRQAVRRVLDHGFQVLGLVRVRAEVLRRNPASIRLLAVPAGCWPDLKRHLPGPSRSGIHCHGVIEPSSLHL